MLPNNQKNRQIPIILFLFLSVFSFAAQAQEEAGGSQAEAKFETVPFETLFDPETRISGFGGVDVGFSTIENSGCVKVGGGGAVLFNERFFIGGFGRGLTSLHTKQAVLENQADNLPRTYEVEMGYGGLWAGYIIRPYKAVNFGFSLRTGAGGISLSEKREQRHDIETTDRLFVFSPEAQLNLNLTSYMRFTLAAGYDYIKPVDNERFSASDLSAPQLSLSVYWGWFNPKR